MLVSTPILEKHDEYPIVELMTKELELFGYYVSNHPSSRYECPKFNKIEDYFDKNITVVGLLEQIRTIKTKKNETMAFLLISDETTSLDFILFSNRIDYINYIRKGDLLRITGHVEKRLAKYQIVINKIEIIKDI